MASTTKVYEVRKRLKAKKAGRRRKSKLEKLGSTPSRAQFFGDTPVAKQQQA